MEQSSSSVGPLDYKELFISLDFSTTTPSSDRYAMHVSVDMTACPWKFNYDDHHVSSTATRDSHDVAPTHSTTSADVRLTPSAAPPLCLCVHDMWVTLNAASIKFLLQPHVIPTTPHEPMTPHVPRPAAHPSPPHCPSAFGSITCGPATYRVHMLLTQRQV